MESMMGAMTRITWSIVQEECLRHMWRSSCNAGIMAMMGRKIGPAHMQPQMSHTQKSHTPSPPLPSLASYLAAPQEQTASLHQHHPGHVDAQHSHEHHRVRRACVAQQRCYRTAACSSALSPPSRHCAAASACAVAAATGHPTWHLAPERSHPEGLVHVPSHRQPDQPTAQTRCQRIAC